MKDEKLGLIIAIILILLLSMIFFGVFYFAKPKYVLIPLIIGIISAIIGIIEDKFD